MKNNVADLATIKARSKKITQIVTKLMEHHKVDVSDLFRKTGIPIPTLNRLRSNKISNPTLTTLAPIADFFSISVSQLIGEQPLPYAGMVFENSLPPKPLNIPILSWKNATDWCRNKKRVLDPETVQWITINGSPNQPLFALKMEGQSMTPNFPEGSLLIFDPELTPKDHSFGLVLLKGNKTPLFKQILLDGNDRYIKSLNSAYANLPMVMLDTQDHILATLIQVQMSFS
ncbi:MAG: helix-turn-helix domain-containing protein [Proteobacteria bacterium]|nr:helix-turn-helix domain-containing protein [Pseudomonadota bacterium]